MNFYTDDKSIIACSTGNQSNTAIAIIRLSGFKSLLDLQKFFSFNLQKTENRKSHLTNIIFKDKVYDNALFVYFPDGQSYTGENVLELSVHGNQLNIQRILDLFIKEGALRSAHPGEFTYRALKNKKLSLSQVEGLDMLLNANSSLMLSQGLDILQGDLHAQYLALYDSFLKLKAAVEISIDFSEDVGAEETQIFFNKSFEKFFKLISALKTRTEGNVSALLSPEIVLVGQTNAGKSSLFNILLKHDRSIVSNIAGTTRDYISEVIHLEGINFKLVDTAGIRESNDVIENIGIDRAMGILSRAFYKILIVNPFETNAEYLKKFSDIDFDFLIFSHSDKKDFLEQLSLVNFSKIKTKYLSKASFDTSVCGSIEPLNMSGPMGPDTIAMHPNFALGGPIEPVNKSGPIEPLKNDSIQSGPIEPVLKYHILKKFEVLTANNPILLERHRNVVNKIYSESVSFKNNINGLTDVAILSSEVNILGYSLTELIGIVSPDDVLNSIFSNFCIGK
ncbi:MAG: 50S ribosome-binding GTPase [Rhizobacter sp.]|nr:50S ribosome-binding GTPase [Bacteriovorax sp.]